MYVCGVCACVDTHVRAYVYLTEKLNMNIIAFLAEYTLDISLAKALLSHSRHLMLSSRIKASLESSAE